MVRQAKSLGINVTCDVSANHVHLSEMDIGYFDSNCHLVPPLRSLRDREALRRGVQDGTVDAICSDHTPVDEDAKQLPFGESEPGATGLELLLSLTLKWGDEAKIPLAAVFRTFPDGRQGRCGGVSSKCTSARSANRLRITLMASGLSSISKKRRPSASAAAPVVPLPAKKSSTRAPGRDDAATIRRKMPNGFCVG